MHAYSWRSSLGAMGLCKSLPPKVIGCGFGIKVAYYDLSQTPKKKWEPCALRMTFLCLNQTVDLDILQTILSCLF